MIGKTLSHYKIIEKIGQGGMGVVYRAEDTNLSREVAIKVLPEQFTQDPQRLARFEREAKLLASLNHPNIAAIYGLEEVDGVRFLALELVEGETLAERVAKGALPVKEALEVCRQIAEGVEAAHEKGVIHRDLKPANVKVTPEGKVKILDFGLAKAFEDEIPAADISQSPTLTEEMTRAGVILGTAAYMSPEQARGKPVDKRADIFAFGAVLYELLTGKRVFEGETVTDTLAKVLEGEPNWKALPKNTPTRIRELMADCLEKGFDDRLPDIGSARIQIKKALKEPAPALPVAGVSIVLPPLWKRALPWSIAAVALLMAGIAFWNLRPASSPVSLTRLALTLPPSERLSTSGHTVVALSPDGTHLVYVANNQLYLRAMDQLESRPIPGTNRADAPFFSPDGRSVGFVSDGKLKKVLISGGVPVTLSDDTNLHGASWGDNGTIVFAPGSGRRGLFRVSAAGGTPVALTTPDPNKGEVRHSWPQILPGSEAVLFTVWSGGDWDNAQIVVEQIKERERRVLIEGGTDARYVPTGHLAFARGGTLMVVPFDLAQLEIIGDPVPVVETVRQGVGSGVAQFAFSDLGSLVYIPGNLLGRDVHEHSLVWVNRDGNETLITNETRDYRAPRISPDGKEISLSVGDPGSYNQQWIYDLEDDSLSRLTFEEERSGSSAWSPDSKWLIFQSGNQGEGGMVRKPADGSLPQERLTSTRETGGRQMPNSWSSDGRFLAFSHARQARETGWDIGILPLEGENEPEYIIATSALECCARFSPNGQWLAYVSNESGIDQVYVRPFQGPDTKRLISEEDEGGGEPVWSPDGKELFYRTVDKMMVVSIESQGQRLRAGGPRMLFEGSYVNHSTPPGFQYYDISPDGKRFLMMTEEIQTQINVVLNWFEELKRLVPTN